MVDLSKIQITDLPLQEKFKSEQAEAIDKIAEIARSLQKETGLKLINLSFEWLPDGSLKVNGITKGKAHHT